MVRLRKDGGIDRRYKNNVGAEDVEVKGKGNGGKKKKGCLKKLGCLGLLLLPFAWLIGKN